MSHPKGATPAHHYRAFGLHISSAVEIPEFIAAAKHTEPDVRIEQGTVAAPSGAEAGLASVGRSLVLVVPEVARYRIDRGSSIIIDPVPDVAERNVRLYLLGSAFGALLHQRGLLPLHANAVEIDGAAVAFMGASGEGKSTLAAWFHDQGHRILADDVCVVKRSAEGQWLVAPGSQRLRLWKEALEASGRDAAHYPRSFEDGGDFQKFDVPFADQHRGSSERALKAIYLLQTGDQLTIDRVEGVRAADALFSHTYRGGFVNTAGLQQAHWAMATELMKHVPIFQLTRPRDLGQLGQVGGLVGQHLGSAHSSL